MISKNSIDDFFNRYASTTNNALFGGAYDINTITNSFSEFVVGASPVGISGGKNDDQYAKAIRQGIEFYKSIGVVSMNIMAKEITVLDDFHAMVRISWNCLYTKGDASGEIPFDVIYFVQSREGSIKIFSYVTGDEQAAFKEHKLVQ